MLAFQNFTLSNGLRTIIHPTPGSGLAVVNLLYQVGARDEDANCTGIAHYLEHLMFGGSKHVPRFDEALQKVGGINNAYTTQDITNYYCKLAAANLETAFWLESDRMLAPSLNDHTLEVQRKVVIEEFKETQLNKPYGDAWPTLLRTAYQVHPYRWPTIGRKIEHVAQVTATQVRDFAQRFYMPNNAVLVVAGDVQYDEVKKLTEKWFGPIPAGVLPVRQFPMEKQPTTPRHVTLRGKVPQRAIYKAYLAPSLKHNDYHAANLLATLLGMGKSAHLYQKLVAEQSLLTQVQAFVTPHFDQGLFVITGYLRPGVSCPQAEEALNKVLADFSVTEQALHAAKNKLSAEESFSYIDVVERADALAWATALGNTNYVNTWPLAREKVNCAAITQLKQHLLRPTTAISLHYHQASNA